MVSNHVDILQECPKDEDDYTCLGYVKITHEKIGNEVHILWACHHGGFKRTVYAIPDSPAINTAGWV